MHFKALITLRYYWDIMIKRYHNNLIIFIHGFLLAKVNVLKKNFVIFIIQMFGSSQKSVEWKLLKDANFPSVYVYVYKCMYVLICLQTSGGRCAKRTQSSYWLRETRNKWCSSCILTTKLVTQTNYYNKKHTLQHISELLI